MEVDEITGAFLEFLHLNLSEISYAEILNPFLSFLSILLFTQIIPVLNIVDSLERG